MAKHPRINRWPGHFARANRLWRRMMKTQLMMFADIARAAGYEAGPGGKFDLPATQQTADRLADAAESLLGAQWLPGTEPTAVVMTGAGPVWGYLAVAHALHGRVARLSYAAPNAPLIEIWSHGSNGQTE